MASAAQKSGLKKDPTGTKNKKSDFPTNEERENIAIDSMLSTADEWISEYREHIVILPRSNRAVKIRSLDPGEQLNIYDDPFKAIIAQAGIDPDDEEARQHLRENLTREQNLVMIESNLANCRRIIVRAVLSLPLRMKPQDMCEPGEMSVWLFSDQDVLYLHQEVSRLSGWTAAATAFQDVKDDAETRESED